MISCHFVIHPPPFHLFTSKWEKFQKFANYGRKNLIIVISFIHPRQPTSGPGFLFYFILFLGLKSCDILNFWQFFLKEILVEFASAKSNFPKEIIFKYIYIYIFFFIFFLFFCLEWSASSMCNSYLETRLFVDFEGGILQLKFLISLIWLDAYACHVEVCIISPKW